MPFGTFPLAAPFPSSLSLLGDRAPGEGELRRSRLPLPLPCFVMSCLKLHDSPLKHFPFANHCLQSLPVFRLSFCFCPQLSVLGAPLAVLSLRASKCRSFVTWSKDLLTYPSSVWSLLVHSSVLCLDRTQQMWSSSVPKFLSMCCAYFPTCHLWECPSQVRELRFTLYQILERRLL